MNRLWAAALLCLAGAAASAPIPEVSQAQFDATPDGTGSGRYPAIREALPGLPRHIVYRPARLDRLGRRKLGLYIWGNAACRADPLSARLHLIEIASHGYLAIAAGDVPYVARPPAPDGSFQVETGTADLRAGLEWALAENRRRASPLFGRIDPHAIAVAGQSCGGLQALDLGKDPRVGTVILLNSGTIPPGAPNPLRGIVSDKSALRGLHAPILQVLGGPRDIAYGYGMSDFADLPAGLPAMVANIDSGHPGTTRMPNGGPVAKLVVDWLEWRLRGDRHARARLAGYAHDPRWTIARRNLD